MREPFDHGPAGRIRQSGKRCTQVIHNRMVVDYWTMSSVDFASPERRDSGTFSIFQLPRDDLPNIEVCVCDGL
jgi:hypothetical protein